MKRFMVMIAVAAAYFLSAIMAATASQTASDLAVNEVSDEDVAALITGRWHGVYAYEDGEIYEFLMHRYTDGAYLIQYRSIVDGQIVDEGREKGVWTVENIEYLSEPTAIEVDGEFLEVLHPRLYRYEIISIDADVFRYRETILEMDFEARRVSDDFQWAPLPYAETFVENSVDMAESGIHDFDDEMRAYIEETGYEFVERYYDICVSSGARSESVAARADALGWAPANVGVKKGTTSWTSFDVSEADKMQKLPFVLELHKGGEESDHGSSCLLGMWGASIAPETAKLEVEIMLDLLATKVNVGEYSVTDKQYYEGRIVEYHAVLEDPANPGLSAAYRWSGGVHWLVAAVGK